MAYATNPDVGLFLGRVLDVDQAVQADFLCDAASAWVQRRTGRSWGSSPVVEKFRISCETKIVYLSNTPTTITEVTANIDFGDSTVLDEGTHYEVYDQARGILSVNSELLDYYDYITVTYTTGLAVPADVKLATVMLAAYWLSNNLDPDRWAYKKYVVGDELAAERELGVPQDVLDITDQIAGGWVVA